MDEASSASDGRQIALRALAADSRGEWDAAHDLVAAHEEDRACAWVHAYLHRKEGDLDNARYWYRRAGRAPSEAPLDLESRSIAAELS